MTKHRKAEDRIAEILEAALEQIDRHGYASLTMDKIIARTSLSKGGVYRFFKNKSEICLALFNQLYKDYEPIDIKEALGWNLSLRDTIVRLLFNRHNGNLVHERNSRVWLQMLPETMQDSEFRTAKLEHTTRIKQKYMQLIRAIRARDHVEITAKDEQRFSQAIEVGELLMEGLVIEQLGGAHLEGLESKVRWYIELILDDALSLAKVC